MGKYVFNIVQIDDRFKLKDSFTEWITESSVYNARKAIEKAYPSNLGYHVMLIKTDEPYIEDKF